MTGATNQAIIRREYREQITFVGIPTPDTTRKLRSLGFDFDRRNGLWFRVNRTGVSISEPEVYSQFAE